MRLRPSAAALGLIGSVLALGVQVLLGQYEDRLHEAEFRADLNEACMLEHEAECAAVAEHRDALARHITGLEMDWDSVEGREYLHDRLVQATEACPTCDQVDCQCPDDLEVFPE